MRVARLKGPRLRDFPEGPMHDAGYALELIQAGEKPPYWKPFASIGEGASRFAIRTTRGCIACCTWRNLQRQCLSYTPEQAATCGQGRN